MANLGTNAVWIITYCNPRRTEDGHRADQMSYASEPLDTLIEHDSEVEVDTCPTVLSEVFP